MNLRLNSVQLIPNPGSLTKPGAPAPAGTTSVGTPPGKFVPKAISSSEMYVAVGAVAALSIILYFIAKRGVESHLISRGARPGKASTAGLTLWAALTCGMAAIAAIFLARSTVFATQFSIVMFYDHTSLLAMAAFVVLAVILLVLFLIFYSGAKHRA